MTGRAHQRMVAELVADGWHTLGFWRGVAGLIVSEALSGRTDASAPNRECWRRRNGCECVGTSEDPPCWWEWVRANWMPSKRIVPDAWRVTRDGAMPIVWVCEVDVSHVASLHKWSALAIVLDSHDGIGFRELRRVESGFVTAYAESA